MRGNALPATVSIAIVFIHEGWRGVQEALRLGDADPSLGGWVASCMVSFMLPRVSSLGVVQGRLGAGAVSGMW
ncbi:hypothetical protein NDN01_22115 [Sphingomonas sp. QA11]|uniref:hypothetical protein n=1 Tax=Sphingomonas sp. QA11 TaxID=2950605 RepID=UPI00234AB718|nr:hypothetical protein [Sphingomonas sp. QA11]WCM26665.1 hypothetical protein NDN01_22115 [Sphingomonas sp. QA11]